MEKKGSFYRLAMAKAQDGHHPPLIGSSSSSSSFSASSLTAGNLGSQGKGGPDDWTIGEDAHDEEEDLEVMAAYANDDSPAKIIAVANEQLNSVMRTSSSSGLLMAESLNSEDRQVTAMDILMRGKEE